MSNVPNSVIILPKISIAWVGCTNITDRRQTTDRQTTDGWTTTHANFAKNHGSSTNWIVRFRNFTLFSCAP